MTFIVAAFGGGVYAAYLIFRNQGYCCDWDKTYNWCHSCMAGGEWAMIAFIGILIGGAAALFVGFWVACSTSMIPNFHKVSSKQDIAALKMVSSISGSFFLGSGSIEQKPVYYYYTKEKGQYQLHYVPALESKIIEDNNQSPSLETWSMEWQWTLKGLLLLYVAFPTDGQKHYLFTIPEGSIAPNFQPL